MRHRPCDEIVCPPARVRPRENAPVRSDPLNGDDKVAWPRSAASSVRYTLAGQSRLMTHRPPRVRQGSRGNHIPTELLRTQATASGISPFRRESVSALIVKNFSSATVTLGRIPTSHGRRTRACPSASFPSFPPRGHAEEGPAEDCAPRLLPRRTRVRQSCITARAQDCHKGRGCRLATPTRRGFPRA
jgi:hypothetical protein